MKKIFIIFFVTSCFMCGCVRTYIRSSSNPDYYGKHYGKILVVANLSDIESQQTVEDAIVNDLVNNGVSATQGYRVFFQGETYTAEQSGQRIKQYGFDAVLSIQFTDSYQTQAYVPQTTTTYGTYDAYGFTAKTYQTGGYYLSQPNFDIRSKLQDGNTFGVVWVSDSNSHGCAICGFDRIMGSFANTLVNQLNTDGVLQQQQQSSEQTDPQPPDLFPPSQSATIQPTIAPYTGPIPR